MSLGGDADRMFRAQPTLLLNALHGSRHGRCALTTACTKRVPPPLLRTRLQWTASRRAKGDSYFRQRAVRAHRLAHPFAAESDESEQSPRPEAGDPVRCCHARVRASPPVRTARSPGTTRGRPSRGRSRGCVPRGSERVRVDDDRVSGEFLASWGARFGFLEPFVTPWPSVYGTEGQRFESSRARYTIPLL